MRLAVEKRSLAIPRRRYFPDRLKEEGENLGSIVIYGYCPGRGPCAGDGMGRQKNRPLLEKKPESTTYWQSYRQKVFFFLIALVPYVLSATKIVQYLGFACKARAKTFRNRNMA
ncbi:unnamed protein product [Bursaphelenchus xylophilus]|uniref:(pine wood nematode) hypothetical protein n=1 Tax=Bursaphelenchus xylophilus TaxID=6326 RepID=A0A7I8WPA3_BURXY|nr:unnamed protein product [Bursaphelenchus xylophilus]CAG9094696.1 unnamed protein product [Bursaphelenchus xylophilus]